jgi:hypothetical protein
MSSPPELKAAANISWPAGSPLRGCAVLIAMLIAAIQFDPAVIGVAVTAVLAGIVAAGSNRSTAKEAMHELTLAETKRTALIGQIDLRLVPNRDELQ